MVTFDKTEGGTFEVKRGGSLLRIRMVTVS